MAQSKEWQEYHLTLRGWVSGSSKGDFTREEVVEPPIDRVLTQRYQEKLDHQGWHRYALPPSYTYEDAVVVEALLARFGPCPNSL